MTPWIWLSECIHKTVMLNRTDVIYLFQINSKKPQNEQMSKQNIPVFIVDSSFDENGIVQPAINYILRKRKFAAPADLFPTPKPDTSYETTHYSIQSDDVYVPPNNPFYKFLME